MAEDKGRAQLDEVNRMLADAVLPADIRPESEHNGDAPRLALLTGACGFLGRQVARELLSNTDLRLICLVREKAGERATTRLARIFSDMGISQEELETRVEVLVGDITEPELGLDVDGYADLAERVDVIYHCAAQVDWVRGYGLLYRMNVGGVLAMIRLACRGPAKRLIFVSSVAVCYSLNGPEHIDEGTDMLPFIGGMPLGYARSKCVAEALLRQAAARGVPVTVLRPALIAGESATGVSSPTDFIAALIQGCVISGMAINTDWLLDCVPVDFVARVMTQVPQGDSNWQVLHLMHGHPRYWRELVLWMNLHGYPVDLVNSDAWIQHLFDEQHARGTMLYAQRQFFCGKPPREGKVGQGRPYEAYLAPSQARIDTKQTRALLAELCLHEAPLDSDLLHAYFDDYRRSGVLPKRAGCVEKSLTLDELLSEPWSKRGISGEIKRWAAAERKLIGTDDGLLSEIAAARVRDSIGLRRLRFPGTVATDAGGPVSAVLKMKVSDTLLQELTVEMARVCRPKLGHLFGQYSDALGLARSHERELALYELDEPRLRQHMPACYGTLRAPHVGRWALLLEHLPEAENKKGRPRLEADDNRMETLLNGLAEIHAVWYCRDKELSTHPWLVATPDTARMLEMTPLWLELADFAAPWFEAWCGPGVRALQAEIIADLAQWWPRLQALPSTLIHNDFNPRNLVLRVSNGQHRLCIYDWELATQGVPQHDLAELLCFTWHGDMTEQDLDRVLETYREALSSASGEEIEKEEWREGFALALRHLFINRLALYTLMHSFRPLDYMSRVMGNWMRLYSWVRIPLSMATDKHPKRHASY